MARTAPVPNIPPIPGMCPSVAVLAGGGDGGGGSGDGTGQGDGNGSGNGDGSGENAEGDGSSANSGDGECPGGTPCPSHASSGGGGSAGDPVDVVTGRVFTLPVDDLVLPGLLPFRFTRQYSSSKPRRDVGFGPGWSHSFAWEIEVRRDSLRLWKDNGTFLRFEHIDRVGASILGEGGMRLTRTPRGYEVDRDAAILVFEAEKHGSWQLTSIRDRNQATIVVDRDDRGITGFTDSVGRKIVFERDAAGRPEKLSVLLPSGSRETFAVYERDARARLVGVVDVVGSRWTYRYDDSDRLASHADPDGLAFHFVYDAEGRCVETWGDQNGTMPPGIMPDHPRRLADGVTPVKGIFHVKLVFGPGGYSEVTTSEMTRRYFGNEHGKLDKEVHAGPPTTREYDDLGLVTRMTDGEGLETLYGRDRRGRMVRAKDRLGREQVIERAPTGEPLREQDPAGGVWTRTFDPRGNKLSETTPDGATWSYRYDDGRLVHTMLPNGGSHRVTWDAHANIAEVVEPDGAVWRATYDYFGRQLTITDPLGIVREKVRDRAGRLVELRHDGAVVLRHAYDALGRVAETSYPDGAVYRYEHGAHKRVIRSTGPDGGVVRMEHDLENRVRRIFNQKGEVHEMVVSPKGQLEAERFFDGRETKLRYDNTGRVQRTQSSRRHRTDFEYDAEGRLLSRTFDDEATHAFVHDPMNRVVKTDAPGVSVTIARDAMGRAVRESFTVMGHSWTLETTRDVMGAVTRYVVGGWVDLAMPRDVAGRIARYDLAGAGAVDLARDGRGRLTRVALPGGGTWRRGWNNAHLLAQQTVEDASGATTVDNSFRYDSVQLLRERTDRTAPIRYFEYDRLRQLVSVRGTPQPEDFSHDATGNVSGGPKAAPSRRYGRGNRLEEIGGGRVVHDEESRIIARHEANGRKWEYQYRPDGMLGRVMAPDKSVTESFYDASGRRMLRTVWKAGKRLRTTAFVWGGDLVLAEVELDGKSATRVRTFLHHAHDGIVLGHHDRPLGQGAGEATAWRFYLSEPGGMPTRLCDEKGRVVDDIDALAFGQTDATATEVRFPGQTADAAAGLYYNHNRFYDPVLGRYLTPDPVGLWAGLNVYRYVDNRPTGLSDLDGLATTVTVTDGTTTATRTNLHGPDHLPPVNDTVLEALRVTPDHQPSTTPYRLGTCAEASAVSDFLEQARAANPGVDDATLLSRIPPGGITINHLNNKLAPGRRAPCPNCRQMLMELGIHPEEDPRIAGNPRDTEAADLNWDHHGGSL